MTNRLDDPKQVKLDRMRYAKNALSSRLTYLAILFNVLYFVSIYQSDVSTWYYNWVMGASIICNLLFLLMAFLASEGVKSRAKKSRLLSFSVVVALRFSVASFVNTPFMWLSLPVRRLRSQKSRQLPIS